MNDFGTMSSYTATADAPPLKPQRTRTIAVTSGKTGVGKTNFIVNVGLELALYRRTVTVLSADPDTMSPGALLGADFSRHIRDIVSGKCSIGDVVSTASRGIRFISGGRIDDPALLKQETRLVNELESIENESDYMFIETPPGVSADVIKLLSAATEVVVVTMPEPTAVVDAYATIKVLHKSCPTKPVWLVVNNVLGIRDGEDIHKQLQTISNKFIQKPIQYLGAIPQDADLVKAVDAQKAIIDFAPGRPSSRSFRIIAKYLEDSTAPAARPVGFWRSLAETE